MAKEYEVQVVQTVVLRHRVRIEAVDREAAIEQAICRVTQRCLVSATGGMDQEWVDGEGGLVKESCITYAARLINEKRIGRSYTKTQQAARTKNLSRLREANDARKNKH